MVEYSIATETCSAFSGCWEILRIGRSAEAEAEADRMSTAAAAAGAGGGGGGSGGSGGSSASGGGGAASASASASAAGGGGGDGGFGNGRVPDTEIERVLWQYFTTKNYKHALEGLAKDAEALPLANFDEDVHAPETFIKNELAAIVHGVGICVPSVNNNDKIEEEPSDRNELSTVTYPIFVHCYLDLLYRGYNEDAKQFMLDFHHHHRDMHDLELQQIIAVTTLEQMQNNETVRTFRENKYSIHLCNYSWELLLGFVQEHKYDFLLRIINQHINVTLHTGKPSQRIDVGSIGHATGS
eukprot:gene2886-5708_t